MVTLTWVLLVVVIPFVGTVPLNTQNESARTQCASFCPARTKFGFEEGRIYDYTYTSTITTHLPHSTSSEGSLLHLTSNVHLQVHSKCEMTLRLSDVTLQDADPRDVTRREGVPRGAEFRAALERHALRVAWVDGTVVGVCPSQGEEVWVVNVKRGILSSMQNVMNDFTTDMRTEERDISGECPVEYQSLGTGWDGTHTIRKTRHTEECSRRQAAGTILQGAAYSTASHLSLLKGTSKCTQTINSHGILTRSICDETQTFRPLSNSNNGASTDITTMLTLTTTRQDARSREGPVGELLPLLYDHTKSLSDSAKARLEAQQLLRQSCQEGSPGVPASDFGRLMTALRQVNGGDLSSLHVSVQQGDFCEKAAHYFRDAIPLLGTLASSRLIKELILASEVTDAERSSWMTSLAFIVNPTPAMLAEVTPLLQDARVGHQAVLGVSSMLNNVCGRRAECGGLREVRAVINILHTMLGTDCGDRASRATSPTSILLALRALGNTGHVQSVVDTLNQCMLNTQVKTEVRVAAIQAFRRMGCSVEQAGLLRLFEDEQTDSELRINAYLALMSSCPTPSLLQRVVSRLQVEEVNQVGSFVWTHLTNLQETSTPLKQHLRRYLASRQLGQKFDLDKRKFSRNIEKSMYLEQLAAGASVESDLVWSSESFVPRSASVNLTVELLGQSVNLLEVGGRMEGVDDILKQVFDRHMPPDDSNETPPDIDRLDKKFPSRRHSKPHGSYFMRVFGNEIAYMDFTNLDARSLREKLNYMNWLHQLVKDGQVDFTKSFQLLDSSLSIPTISGFPLRMRVEGNAVTDIKVKGKVDIRQLFSESKSLVMEASIAPSASVAISAEMVVDARVAQSGMRTLTTLLTNTAADGKVELRNGELFTVDINMREASQDIVNARHEFLVVRRGVGQPWRSPQGPRVEVSQCVRGRLTSVTGLEACAQVSVPSGRTSLWTALTSPSTLSLTVSKTDTFRKYHFEASLYRITDGHNADRARISINTPGSTTDREMTIDYVMNPQDGALKLDLRSPWKKVQIRGSVIRTARLQQLHTRVTVDDNREYSLEAELQRETSTPRSWRYRPRLQVTLPDRPPSTITADLLYKHNQKVSAQLEVENVFRLPVTLHLDVGIDSTGKKKLRLDTSMAIKSEWVSAGWEGFFDRIKEKNLVVHSSRLSLHYTQLDQTIQRIVLSNKLRDTSNRYRADYTFTSGLTNTLTPAYNYGLTASVSLSGQSMAAYVDAVLDNDRSRSLLIKQNASLSFNGKDKSGHFDLHVKLPLKGIDHRVQLEYKHFPDEFLTSARLLSAQEAPREVNIHLKRSSVGRKLQGKLHYPGREVMVLEELTKSAAGSYNHIIRAQLRDDQRISCLTQINTGQVLRIDSQFTSPFTKETNVRAYLQHTVSLLNAGFEGSYGADRTLNMSARAEGSDTKLFLSYDFDLKMPNGNMSLMSNMTLMKWDKLKAMVQLLHNERNVEWSTDMTFSKTKPHFLFRTKENRRYFEVDFYWNLEHEHLGDLPDCHFETSFFIKSSCRYFDNIGTTITATHKGGQIDGSAILALNNDLLNGTLSLKKNSQGWADVEGMAEARGFTRGKEDFNVSLSIKIQDSYLKATGKAFNADREADIVMLGRILNSGFEGSLKMTSSDKDFEELLLKLNYTREGVKASTKVVLSVTSSAETSTIALHRAQRFSPIYTNIGNISLTHTARPRGSFNLTWNHTQKGDNILTTATWKHSRAVHTLTYVSNIKDLIKDADLEVSTINAYTRNMIFKCKYVESPHSVKLRSTFQEGDRKHELIDANINFNGFEFDADIDLNLLTTRKVLASNKRKGDAWDSSFKYYQTYGNRPKDFYKDIDPDKSRVNLLEFHSEIKPLSREFEGHLNLNGYSGYKPRWKIDIEKFEGRWSALVDLKSRGKYLRHPNLTYSGTLDMNTGGKVMCDLEFNVPYLGHKSSNLVLEGGIWDFETRLDLQDHVSYKRVTFDLEVNLMNMQNTKVNLHWTTPFEFSRQGRLEFWHQLVDSRAFTTGGLLEIPGYRFQLYNRLVLDSWRSFSIITELTYGQNHKLALSTRFNAGGTTSLSIEVETPFTFADYLSLKINYQGPIRDCKGSIVLGLDRKRTISVSVERYHERDIHFITRVSTPFQNFKTMGIDFNFVGYMDDYQQDWAFTVEDKRLSGQNIFRWKGQVIDYTSAMQTPLVGYENMVFTFNHEGPLHSFEHMATFEYPQGKSILHNTFKYEEGILSVSSDAQLASLLQHFLPVPDKLGFLFNHTWHLGNFQNIVKLNVDELVHSAGSKVKMDVSNIEVTAHVLDSRQTFSLSTKHADGSTIVKGTLNIHTYGQDLNTSAEFRKGDDIGGKFDLQTTYEALKYLSISINHKGSWNNFMNNCTLHMDGVKYNAGAKFLVLSEDSYGISGKVFISLPEEYSLSLTTSADAGNMRAAAVIKMQGATITSSSKLSINNSGFDASFVLKTPFENYRKVQATFKHTKQSDYLGALGSFSIDDEKYDSKLTIRKEENISTLLEFKSPSHFLTIDSVHHGTSDNFRNTIAAKLNDMKYSCDLEFTNHPDSLNMKAEIKDSEEYSLVFQMKVEPSRFLGSFVIGISGRNIHGTISLDRRSNGTGANIVILTPFQYFERQSLRFSHAGHRYVVKTSGHIETSAPGYESIGFNFDHNGHSSHFSTAVDIHTPFRIFKSASVNIDQHAGRNYMKNDVSVTYNRAYLSSAVTFEKTGDNVRLSATAASSFTGYEKFVFSINKEGTWNNFHCEITVNIPIKFLPMIEMNIQHAGHTRHFTNGLIINYNGNSIKANSDVNLLRGTEISASVELPIEGFEKFIITYSHKRDDLVYNTMLHVETPFENLKSGDFRSKLLPTRHRFELAITTYFIHPMEFSFKNILLRNGITTSASLLLPKLRINLVNSMSRTLTKMAASGSIETSISNLERFAYTCALDGGEEEMLHLTAKLDHPFRNLSGPGIQVSLKLMDEWYRDLELTAILTTFSKSEPPINLNIMHKYDPEQHVATSAYVTYNNRKINGAFQYSKHDSTEEWRGLLNLPVSGYERFAYSLRQSRTSDTTAYSGRIETPLPHINNPSFDVEVERSENLFKVSGSVTTPLTRLSPVTGSLTYNNQNRKSILQADVQTNDKYVRLASDLERGHNFLNGKVAVETAFSGYRRFGFTFTGEHEKPMLKAKLDVTLPKVINIANPFLEINHNGSLRDFNTAINFQVPSRYIKPVSLSLKNTGLWLDFDREVSASYGTLHYHGNMKLQRSRSGLQFATLLTTPTKERYSFDITNSRSRGGFTTSIKAHIPHEQYIDPEVEITHVTLTESYTTSIRVTTPFRNFEPLTLSMDSRGHLMDFVKNIQIRYNGQTISINGAFEKKNRNAKASGELHTPFAGYEHFGFALSHNENAGKVRTAGNIILPFRRYVSPSFDIDHSGHRQDFRTKITVRTPFQDIDPIEIDINHEGHLKDFQSSINTHYQGQTLRARLTCRLLTDNTIVSALIDIPLFNGEKLPFSIDYRNDGKTIFTKASIGAEALGYEKIAFEIGIEGMIKDFHINTRLDAPFPWCRSILFSLDHKGSLTDFDVKALVEVDKQRSEGEIKFQWNGRQSTKQLVLFSRVSTPWYFVRRSQIALSQSMSSNEWSGNIRALYNREAIDADYTLSSKGAKTLDVTIRQPKSMQYTITLDPAARSLILFLNWDKHSPSKQMRVEATMRIADSDLAATRELQVNVSHPEIDLKLSAGHRESVGKRLTEVRLTWGEGRRQEITFELERTASTQQTSLTMLKVKALGIRAEVEQEEHEGESGDRYLHKLVVRGKKTLIITSDLTHSDSLFRGTLNLNHPSLPQRFTIKADVQYQPGPMLYTGKVSAGYSQDNVSLTWRLADLSTSRKTTYEAELGLKQSDPTLDTHVRVALEETADALTADLELVHLMTGELRQRKFIVQTMVNKLTEEFLIKLKSPDEHVHIGGRQVRESPGRLRYVITATGGSNTIAADIKVDQTAPNFDLTASINPRLETHLSSDNYYHNTILATGVTGTTLHIRTRYTAMRLFTCEVYRQVADTRAADVEVGIWMNEGHVIRARAFARPGLVDDSVAAVKTAFSSLDTPISSGQLTACRREVVARVKQMFNVIFSPLSSMAHRNDYFLAPIGRDTLQLARRILQHDLSGYLDTAWTACGATYREMSRLVGRVTERLRIAASPYTRYFHGSLLDLANHIRRRPGIQRVLTMIDAGVKRMAIRACSLMDRASETFNNIFNSAMPRPVTTWLTFITKKTRSLAVFLGLESPLRSHLEQLARTGLAPARRALWRGLRAYLHMEETRITAWQPERGLIELQVYIPHLLSDVTSLPSYFEYVRETLQYLRVLSAASKRLFYTYTPSSDMRNWVAPFQAHAMIVGGKHFMTFDRRFYDFTGDCSYLLVRDVIAHTFAVTINFELTNGVYRKKSLTVIHNSHQVEILSDFKVIVDGSNSELPVSSEHTTIYREGNVIHVDSDHGVKVTCELPHDICTVLVTGWYHGKLAGLLGTFNNEPADDFLRGDGARAETPEQLADSWAVGDHCAQSNHAPVPEPSQPTTPSPLDACAELFLQGGSQFAPCFGKVDPSDFRKMCVDGDICQVAAFYVTDCRLHEVPLVMPNQCIACQASNGQQVMPSHPVTYIPRTADVIFVVSHATCNQNIVAKLPDIARNLERALKVAGLAHARFGLVGYGGVGALLLPRVNTLDGRLTNTRTAFARIVSHFQPVPNELQQRPKEDGESIVDGEENGLAAVRLAATYPFRPSAAKLIVLVHCDACRNQHNNYASLRMTLHENSIRLLVLRDYDFLLKASNRSPKSSLVFGVDQDKVYTKMDVSRHTLGNAPLRTRMSPPEDTCATLTRDTGGALFASGHLTKFRNRKSFIDVFTRVAAAKMTSSTCQTCRCQSDAGDTGSGHVICREC